MPKPTVQQKREILDAVFTPLQSEPPVRVPPDGSAADTIHMYVVEYEHGRFRFQTVVEARSIEAAKRQFRRDNPDVEMLSIV